MPLGNPIRKQNESRIVSVLATEGQTVFTVQGGYIVNQISVFRNGVRLSNSEDFTAGDGSTVTLNNAANIEDRIEFHVFDRFTVQNAIVSAASTQTISGDVVVNGKIFGNLDVPNINTGIITATNLNISGISTFQNNVHLLDSDRLQIGGSVGTVDGFELYHDGSHSYIADSGTGELRLRASVFNVQNPAGDETLIGATSNDSVALYFNNNQKLVTTNTGAIVTGILTANGLDVSDKITHTGDTDTAIRFPASDTVTVETAGSERIRIDSSGRLLVGLNSDPAESTIVAKGNSSSNTSYSVLDMRRGQAATSSGDVLGYIRFSDTNIPSSNNNYALISGACDGTSSSGSDNPGRLVFSTTADGGTSASERLRIDRLGRVLVGKTSTSLSHTLQVQADSSANAIVIYGRSADDIGEFSFYENDGTTKLGEIQYRTNQLNIRHRSEGADITFATVPSGGSLGDRVTIKSDGKVGINETSPDSTFHVNSGAETVPARFESTGTQSRIGFKASGTANTYNVSCGAEAENFVLYTNNAEKLRMDSSGHLMIGTTTEGFATYGDQFTIANTGHCGMSIRSGTSSYGTIYFSDGDDGSSDEVRGFIDYNHSNNKLQIGTNAVTRLVIDSSGKVRVGNGDPTYNFEVQGSGQQTILIGSTNAGGAYLTLDGDSNGDGSGGDYSSIGHNTSGNLVLSADNPSANAVMMFITGDGNEKMRIDDSGRLLIAATSGTARVHIKGNGGDGIKIENSGGTNAACIDLKNTLSSYNKEYRIAVAGSDGAYGTASSLFVRDQTAGQTRLELTTSGDLKVNTGDIFFGGAGRGIVLGATTNLNSNTLDDYEEGTFTPRLGPHNNHSIYENGTGQYTKIGDTITYTMSWQNKDATSFPTNARIEIWNLPFTFKNPNSAGEHQVLSALMMHNVQFAANEKHYFYSIQNGNNMLGLKSRDGTTWIEWGTADWNQSGLYYNTTGSFFVNG